MNDFYATLDLNISSLTPRSVKLLAFYRRMQTKRVYPFGANERPARRSESVNRPMHVLCAS